MSPNPPDSEPWEAPRVSVNLRNLFLNQLDRGTGEKRSPDRRQGQRLTHRLDAGIMIVFYESGGSEDACLVHPRNIGQGGIAVVHEAFVAEDTPCMITIPTADEDYLQVEGKVVSCRHINGRLHELGITFREPIDLDQILPVETSTDEKA